MSQALTVANGQQLQQTGKSSTNFMEVKNMASVFYASGMFGDVKSEAQAMVKIFAGNAFGFDPITSMAYVHIIQGKAYLGAKLQAGLIKASGRYNYRVVEHTDKVCSIQFTQLFNNKWENLGLPVRYTIEQATTAGVTSNPTWKKHPMAMLFASCIRQGMTRYTPDLLRNQSSAVSYGQITNEIEDIPELKAINTVDEVQTETPVQDYIDAPVDPNESTRADLETHLFDLLQTLSGGDAAKTKSLLKNRNVKDMQNDEIRNLIGELEKQ